MDHFHNKDQKVIFLNYGNRIFQSSNADRPIND